ncbi:hypothetical protein BG015_004137 [Linnemannia schmuckeri]|uniref:SH3 domain-containing protein n=1 Tax=Linnemannia schmuckeri TaxID=64567 RepID=A0A9P5RF41_9FUNG|nr:hypothetical protein BG015_004137 [Linnemannia schmuckeri]
MTQPTSSPRRHWLTKTLVPLALIASANAKCISLADSTACPGFTNLQVDTSAAATLTGMGMGLTIANFDNLAQFDKAIQESTAFYTSPESCSGYNRTEHIRYQNTVACAMITQDKFSVACSSTRALSMCRTTCTEYATSLAQMIAKSCPGDPESNGMAKQFSEDVCTTGKTFSGLSSTDTTTCVNGLNNEDKTCGFASTEAMCSFCKTNAADACCAGTATTCNPLTTTTAPATTTIGNTPPASSPTTPITNQDDSNNGDKKDGLIAGLSTAALGGIIGGGVVLILLFFAFIVCCIRRNRSNNGKGGNKVHGHAGNGGANNLSRHMSNSSASKYKISSPKLQEEGFSTGQVPSAPIPMTALPSLNVQPAAAAAVAGGAAANRISKASSVGGASAVGGAGGKQYCQALYPYQASMADELDLSPGDIVNVHKVFDDGWAVGVNMNTSNEGAFPVVCVMFVEESALHDDFEDVNMHSMTPMGHREDDNGRAGSPRSSMPSRASSPVHLPRRQSSMIRDSVVIPGLSNGGRSSPLAGSPLAGGNHAGSKLQPPVRDTMMSDASSINRWWDGEGK